MPGYDDIVGQMQNDQAATGMAPAKPVNRYEAAVSSMAGSDHARAALAVGMSADVNPDRAAQNRALAKRYGTAPEVVDAYPEEFRQRMLIEAARQTLATAPKLQQTINDQPTTAGVIHDDLPNAAAVEQTATRKGLLESLAATPMESLKGLGGAFNKAAGSLNLVLGAFPTIYDKITGGSDASDWWFKNMVDPVIARQERYAPEGNAGFPEKAANTAGSLLGTLSQITLSGTAGEAPAATGVGQAVAGAVEHGAKAMLFPALNDAVDTGRRVYSETGDTASAVKAAQAQYLASTGMGVVPMSLPGKLATRMASGFGIGMGTGELSRQYMNTALPPSMRQQADFEEMLLSGIAGAVLGVGGPHELQAPVRKAVAEEAGAHQAERDFNDLTTLGQLSAVSKWRERDPEGFKQFVENATEDGHLANVYVEAKQFAQALDGAGIKAEELMEKMPEVAVQMREALHTDGYLQIPTADYATHIAGSPVDAVLLQHLKTDPEGKTYAEAQQFYQGQAERMKQAASELVADKTERDAFQKSQEAVQAKIQQELDGLGRTPADVNRIYAGLQSSILGRIAARLGITPEEAHAKYGAALRSEGAGDFQQGATDEATGLPLNPDGTVTLYHHTSAEAAEQIRKTGRLKADAEPDVYLTTRRETDTGYGDTAVPVLVDPRKLQLDDEFPDGRQDFRMSVGKPGGAVKVQVGEHGDVFNQSANTPLKPDTTHVEVDGVQRHALNSNGQPIAATEEGVRNFWRWFGDSKVVDAEGKPLVVYHGTTETRSTPGKVTKGDSKARKQLETMAAETGIADWTSVPSVFERLMESGRGAEFGITAERAAKARELYGAARGRADRPSTDLAFDVFNMPDTGKELGAHFGTKAQASSFGDVFDFYLSIKNPLRLPDLGTWDYQSVMREARKRGAGITTDEYDAVFNAADNNAALRDLLMSKGYDGVVYANEAEGKGDSYIAFDPTQIKSATGNDGGFDPQNLSILRQGEEARGSYAPDRRTIALLKDADLSTYLHETGHWALDVYGKIAAGENAPPEIRADMDKILKWFSVESLDKWNSMSLDEQRPYHEQFARGFEAYLMEGKAPGQELAGPFARVRAWMTSIYQSLRNLNVTLSTEVRGVFDRMLASEEAIQEAQAARVFELLFKEKPAGMTAEEWAAYRDLGEQATQDAITDMQARSVRDMKWLSNAKSKALRELQREARQARDQVRAQVEKQVNEEPVYRMQDWLKEHPEARGEHLDADVLAETFGFPSGEEAMRALADAQPRKEVIEGLTDRRMLEEHGEIATPDALERAANEAVHNAARARFVATGLKVLTNSPVPARVLEKGAKEAADSAIGSHRVRDVNPRQYLAAETKANKEALKLAAKNPEEAVHAQRAALLNNQLVRAAYEAQDLARKAVAYAKSFDKRSKRLKIDPEERDLIDSLLQRFDFRQVPTDPNAKQKAQLAQWVDAQKANGYTPREVPDMLDESVRVHYKDMTVDQLRGLMDTIRSIEKIGREKNRITVDGKRMEVAEAVAPIVDKMKERGEKFSDRYIAEGGMRAGVDPLWRVTLDRVSSFLRAGVSEVLRPDYKANKYDLHQILGPMQKAVFERLFGASYEYGDRMDAVSRIKREGMAKYGLDKEWQHSLDTLVGNHNLLDNSLEVPAKRRLTRGDLIGIAMHVGNESNFDKLAKGMGWEPATIWQALHDNMTEKDWRAAQVLGEMAGAHWGDMAEMNRRLGNDTPDKIEPRPFPTKFGEMPGWYSPIRYDPIRSKLGKKKAEASAVNPSEGLFASNYFRADTTTNGSLNSRVSGYYDFIDLNWRPIEKAITDTVRDLAFREALIDAHKVYANKEFRSQFQRTYGPEEYKHLGDWMGRLVNSEVGDEASSKYVAIASGFRKAMVANGVAFRISTMFKHGGSAGFKSMGMLSGGGEKYFASRVAAMSTNYSREVADGLAKFPELRQRLRQQDRDFKQTVGSLFEPESVHGKAERFGHAGVAWMDFFTAVPTAHAAYDWAVTTGIPKRLGGTGQPMTHADAVKFASKVVREAHSSTNEASQSLVITSRSEMVKMLTTLHGFMNNAFGQNADALDKVLHANGFGKPELLARTMWAQIMPAIMAGWVTFGGPNEDESWLGWAFHHIGGEFAGMLPMVREAWSVAVEGFDKAGLPPWMRALQDIGKAAKSVVKGAEGEPVKHPIKDVGNAAGLLLPGLGQAGATTQLIHDVATGDQHPETVGEWIRGLMTGQATRDH